MNKILVAVFAGAALASVIYYLNDPEKVEEQLKGLKQKGSDILDKAREAFAKGVEETESMA